MRPPYQNKGPQKKSFSGNCSFCEQLFDDVSKLLAHEETHENDLETSSSVPYGMPKLGVSKVRPRSFNKDIGRLSGGTEEPNERVIDGEDLGCDEKEDN